MKIQKWYWNKINSLCLAQTNFDICIWHLHSWKIWKIYLSRNSWKKIKQKPYPDFLLIFWLCPYKYEKANRNKNQLKKKNHAKFFLELKLRNRTNKKHVEKKLIKKYITQFSSMHAKIHNATQSIIEKIWNRIRQNFSKNAKK